MQAKQLQLKQQQQQQVVQQVPQQQIIQTQQQPTSVTSLLAQQQQRPALQVSAAGPGNTKYAVTPQVVQQGKEIFFFFQGIVIPYCMEMKNIPLCSCK